MTSPLLLVILLGAAQHTGQMSPTSDVSSNRVRSVSGTNRSLRDWAEYIVTTGQYVAQYGSGSVTATGSPTARSANDRASDTYSVKDFRAKGDQRSFTDAAMTAGTSTLTSATAAFTSADTGKVVTVQAGAQGISAGTYTSGGSIAGTTGQTCTLSEFNGGGSGATAIVNLTGTNTIAGGTALMITATGTGFSSSPTTATLGNGTATCSGTATVSITGLYVYPITATATYVAADTVTLSTTATTTVSGATAYIGTDDSQAFQDALNAVSTTGGTIQVTPGNYLVLSKLTIHATDNKQPPITIRGPGGSWDGTWQNKRLGGAIVDLRYSGSGAKLVSTGAGLLTVDGVSFVDNGYSTTPFLSVSNTTLVARRNTFTGAGPGRAASVQDAIVLASPSVFQGYGPSIEGNYFGNIHHGVRGGTFTNAVNIVNNTWSAMCGGDEALLLDGSDGGMADSNSLIANLFELVNYKYGITFNVSKNNVLLANTYWDEGANYRGILNLVGASTGTLTFPFLHASEVTDPAANGWVALGSVVTGLQGLSIGRNSYLPGALQIYSTTNKLRLTYPGVVDVDTSVDSGATLTITGQTATNINSRTQVFALGAGVAPAGTQGLIHASGTGNKLRLTYPAVADSDIYTDSGGFLVLAPTANRGIKIGTSGAAPGCSSATRGQLFYTPGGAGVADAFQVCAKDSGDAYAWRTIY